MPCCPKAGGDYDWYLPTSPHANIPSHIHTRNSLCPIDTTPEIVIHKFIQLVGVERGSPGMPCCPKAGADYDSCEDA